jgi:hypothetical protein
LGICGAKDSTLNRVNRPIQWDAVSLRVDGLRVNDFVRAQAAGQIDEINITFREGNIHVAGRKQLGFVPIPFFADVNGIFVEGRTIVVPVSILPIAAPILRGIVASKIPPGVTIRPPFTFVIEVERFLPTFVDVRIREIRIIDGGLAISLGPGGAFGNGAQ